MCASFVLQPLGALVIGYFGAQFVWFLLFNVTAVLLMQRPRMTSDESTATEWAVVTGASDGIGKAFANELARRSLNVVLISRTKSKLDDVASEIEGKYKTQTKVIPFDFSTAEAREYKRLFNELDSIEVSVLINNVGLCYKYPTPYDEIDVEQDVQMLKVNCEPTLRMTKYVVERRKREACARERVPRRDCHVVFLSSISAHTHIPRMSTYSATKSFGHVVAQCLAKEAQAAAPSGTSSGSSIHYFSLTPNIVVTPMAQRYCDGRVRFPDAVPVESMARQALNKVVLAARINSVVLRNRGGGGSSVGRRFLSTVCSLLFGLDVVSADAGHWQHAWIEWMTLHLVPKALLRSIMQRETIRLFNVNKMNDGG